MMEKYIAEIWVKHHPDMKEDEVLKGIRDAYNEYYDTRSGHFKISRVCNVRKKDHADEQE